MKRLLYTALLLFLGACANESGGPAGAPPENDETPPLPAAPAVDAAMANVPRLTGAQYENVIHDVFGEDIVAPSALEPDVRTEGLVAIGAAQTSISPRGVEQYESAAFAVAEQVFAEDRAAGVTGCTPSGSRDDACAEAFLRETGQRLWRRPLTDEEAAEVVSVAGAAADVLGDFYEGLSFGLAALLESPYFVFRVELGEPDGGDLAYTDYEMASRLSFFLWNTTPDDALLDAAAAGRLTEDETLLAEVDRMLADDKARQGLRAFITDIWELDRLDDLVKDPTIFTQASPELGPYAREETLRVVEHLAFEEDADFRRIFTLDYTFANPKLAALYMVPAAEPEGFHQVIFPPESPRRGLLGHASFLALNAHATSSSATLRGKFVRVTLLCEEILPPPVNVDTSLPEPSGETLTLRERVQEHLTDPFCAGCHRPLDTIGLGLEQFDGIGRFRTSDHGGLIDPSGELDGQYFADAIELGQRLADDPRVPTCLAENMYRYATRRAITDGEADNLAWVNDYFSEAGYRIEALMRAIVMSPGFRRATPPAEVE